MATLVKVWAFVKRDFLQQVSYRLNFLISLAGILLSCLTFFFFSRLIQGQQIPSLAPYGGEYFPFVLVGLAFDSFLSVGLQSLAESISRAQTTGTLEALLVTPTPVAVVIFASTIFSFLFAAARVVVYLLFGALFFGVGFGRANLPVALLVLGSPSPPSSRSGCSPRRGSWSSRRGARRAGSSAASRRCSAG